MTYITTSNILKHKIKELPIKIKELPYKIKDIQGISYLGNWEDLLNTSVTKQHIADFIRKFDINVSADSKSKKEFSKSVKSCIGTGILKVSNAGQIISDIRFYDKVLNETNWDETLTPFGYGKWKVLITGDYIYQKALCKYVMQASLNADRPNTRQYLHKVDVPDCTDRGTIDLTTDNQPYEVDFKPDRKFHIVPEVNTTIKAFEGINTTPIIIPYDVSTKGFKLVMKVDGKYVAGKVTYAARGY